MVRLRRQNQRFENNKEVGAFADVAFEIGGETRSGSEKIRFDTRIHYMEKGEGEPLLLLHGIGQSLYTWRGSIDFFAKNGYRVIAPDMPGFGYSDCPNIYYTVEEYALIAAAFLDAMHVDKAHIAGFSTGALSALVFAHEHPRRTGKLVLVSPGGPNEDYPFLMKYLTTWLGHRLARFILSESMVRRMLHEQFFDTPLVTADVADEYFAPFKRRDVRETLPISMSHFEDQYARSLLKGTKQNVLVFSGRDDKMHGEKVIKAYAQNIPGAHHLQFRNCGHYVHEEKPGRFNDETLKFLQREENFQLFS